MIRLSNLVAQILVEHGVFNIFGITGGSAMFLNEAFGCEPRLYCVYNHHEQASTMAAEGYARASGRIGVVNVTSGPGGINALNGVFGAWTDSIPLLVISGQVKRETCITTYPHLALRQLGDQEADIIRMVSGITKYAVQVNDPQQIRYHLEKALYIARSGRPGPCWLDIPIDVQSSLVDEKSLPSYDPEEDVIPWDRKKIQQQCILVIEKLKASSRPVILAGTGVRLAGAAVLFDKLIHKLGIPTCTAWTHDLIATDDPLFCGRPGTIGTRAGNFTVQNSDTLLVIGSRLNIRQVSYNWKSFAHHAYKIQVDVDPAELDKPTVKPDMAVHSDARIFLEELDKTIDQLDCDPLQHKEWLAWCKERLARFPTVTSSQRIHNGFINPYHFIEELFDNLDDDDLIVTGNGAACVMTFQAARLQKGQRLFSNSGAASMGYDLPAAIGAAFARDGKRVICLAGDGSIQMNIQELQTVFHHQLNIKLFVMNNNGYLSIRNSQKNFFNHQVGESPQSGLTFPDIVKVGKSYGIPSFRLRGAYFGRTIPKLLKRPGPVLCDVVLDPDQTFEPRISSRQLPDGKIESVPLEDMYPFLDRKEFSENMIVEAEKE